MARRIKLLPRFSNESIFSGQKRATYLDDLRSQTQRWTEIHFLLLLSLWIRPWWMKIGYSVCKLQTNERRFDIGIVNKATMIGLTWPGPLDLFGFRRCLDLTDNIAENKFDSKKYLLTNTCHIKPPSRTAEKQTTFLHVKSTTKYRNVLPGAEVYPIGLSLSLVFRFWGANQQKKCWYLSNRQICMSNAQPLIFIFCSSSN